MFGFTGRATCWIENIHMVSGLTPDHWNWKALFFSFLLAADKEFQHKFYKQCVLPKLLLFTQFHFKVCIVCLSSKAIDSHSLFYSCEMSIYITKTVPTTFTFSTLSRHILSIDYVTKPIVKATN